MTETVRIFNKRPTLIHLPPPVNERKDEQGRKSYGTGASISLQPGKRDEPVATVVSAAEWERAQQHPSIRDMIKMGWIGVATAEERMADHALTPQDLLGYNAPTSISLIETEKDRDVLGLWLLAETRETVKAALDARLVALPAPKAKK